jgi:hypothetical protein
MTRKLWSARRLVPLGLVAVAVTAAAAQAAGGGTATKPRPPRAMSAPLAAVPAPVAAGYAGPPGIVTVAPLGVVCRPRTHTAPAPATAPPSEALKNAFGILRRDRNDDDALPARALAALKLAGLKLVDPQAARLLRADGAARAWVVPVPDVGAGLPDCSLRRATRPREGLAVVSLGGAPAGGGGALSELQRGTAMAALDPCAGTGRNMLSVSGIVPDGVDGVFIAAADGSATRADVHDNGFAFVLPRPRRIEPRYLVWTGSDGKPHVQPLAPLPLFRSGPGGACPKADHDRVRVTPSRGAAFCGQTFAAAPSRIVTPGRAAPGAVARARARARALVLRRSPRAARPLPVAPAPLPAYACTASGGPLLLAPTPLPRGVTPAILAPGGPAPAPRPSRPRPPRTR